DLFVSDFSRGNIYEYAPDGARSTFAAGLGDPAGLAFDNTGDLFVADDDTGRIYEYAPGGTRNGFASGLSFPNGLAFDYAAVPEPWLTGTLAGIAALFAAAMARRRAFAG